MHKFGAILLLGAFLLQSGCISRRRVIPEADRLLPFHSIDRSELLERLEASSRLIRTLRAPVTLEASGGGLTTGVMTDYRQFPGIIVVGRPDDIRLQVQLPLVRNTVFDMVSDGTEYRASIPSTNKFAVGAVDAPPNSANPMMNLRPTHILEALFVDILDYTASPDVRPMLEEAVVGQRNYYVISFIDITSDDGYARIDEKIWIDRTTPDLDVARKQTFQDGRLTGDVQFSDYRPVGNVRFPFDIVVHRPIEDYTLRILFQEPTINAELADNSFVLERPPGAELVQLGSQPGL